MLHELFTLEGYSVQDTSQGDEALGILQGAKGGQILYLEPLLLKVRGNERFREYVLGRGLDDPNVFFLLAGLSNVEGNMGLLMADGSLALPFTLRQVLASIEEAQRLLHAKQS